MSRPALETEQDQQQGGDGLEHGDDERRHLAGAEDTERAAHRLERVDVAQDDAGQHIGERCADERRVTSVEVMTDVST